MKKIAVMSFVTQINYVTQLMLELGKERVTYFCDEETITLFTSEIKKIVRAGIEVIIDDFSKAIEYEYFFADIWWLYLQLTNRDHPLIKSKYKLLWLKIANTTAKKIYYAHGTDAIPRPPQGSGILYSSTQQFFKGIGPGLYVPDYNNVLSWGRAATGGEGVVAGLIHMHDWPKVKSSPKEQLRKEVEEKLGVKFDPNLPIVVYHTAESPIRLLMDKGLEQLSNYANIVIKEIPTYRSFAKGKNITVYNDKINGNYLLRAAADFVIAGATSGTLFTCLMLGLRTIPVYTQYIDVKGKGGRDITSIIDIQRDKDSFAYFLTTIQDRYKDILQHITPLNIESTDMISKRMSDCEYWMLYDENISNIQKGIFGNYYIDDASQRAATYIKNFMDNGTFADANTLNFNKAIQGEPCCDASCITISL